MANSSDTLFSKALKLSTLLAVAIAVAGSLLGYLFYQLPGVFAALLGAGVSALFGTMTILSIWFGGKLSLNGFYAMVLGGWLFKVFVVRRCLARLTERRGLCWSGVFLRGRGNRSWWLGHRFLAGPKGKSSNRWKIITFFRFCSTRPLRSFILITNP